MAHEMSLTLMTKLFLGSLRASRAIKKNKSIVILIRILDYLVLAGNEMKFAVLFA